MFASFSPIGLAFCARLKVWMTLDCVEGMFVAMRRTQKKTKSAVEKAKKIKLLCFEPSPPRCANLSGIGGKGRSLDTGANMGIELSGIGERRGVMGY